MSRKMLENQKMNVLLQWTHGFPMWARRVACLAGLFLVSTFATGCAAEMIQLSTFGQPLGNTVVERRQAREVLVFVNSIERLVAEMKRTSHLGKGEGISECASRKHALMDAILTLARRSMEGFKRGILEQSTERVLHHHAQVEIAKKRAFQVKRDWQFCFVHSKSYNGMTSVTVNDPFCKNTHTRNVLKKFRQKHAGVMQTGISVSGR